MEGEMKSLEDEENSLFGIEEDGSNYKMFGCLSMGEENIYIDLFVIHF